MLGEIGTPVRYALRFRALASNSHLIVIERLTSRPKLIRKLFLTKISLTVTVREITTRLV